jgi:hypothetical protein
MIAVVNVGTLANYAQVLAVFAFPIVGFLIRYAWRKIKEEMNPIKAEMTPNHGSSLRDAIDRIEQRQMEFQSLVMKEIKRNNKKIKKVERELRGHLEDYEYEYE